MRIFQKFHPTITGKSKAQTLVEFAMILPVLLISLFVIIELARVLHAWLAVENGARVGVRYAVTGEYNTIYCTDNLPAPPSGPDGICDNLSAEPGARIRSIHDAAWAGSTSIIRYGETEVTNLDPSFFQTTVCAGTLIKPGSTFDTYQCQGGIEIPGDPGDKVTVVLEFNHPLILPFFSNIWPQLRLTALREATVETFRITQSSGSPPIIIAPTPAATNTPPDTPTSPPPPDVPECSSVSFTNWKPYPKRWYVLLRDNNGEDGYITNINVTFPDHVGGANYYIDYMDFNPDSTDTDWEYPLDFGNHDNSPDSHSFSAPNNFRVSPPGYNKSRISVGFAGPLPGGQLPPGLYIVSVEITYPGFPITPGSNPCTITTSHTREGPIATSTSSGGGSGTDAPTPEFPPTATLPDPETPPGPTSTSPPQGD
jgi:hypothetical protein